MSSCVSGGQEALRTRCGGPTMRIAVLAHNLRAGGGVSVGKNLIAALGRAAPQHSYLFVVPAGLGYEQICHAISGSRVIAHERSDNPAKQFIYSRYTLPVILESFKPELVLALGNFGVLEPPAPQVVLVHQPHLFYPVRHYGRTGLRSKLKVFCQKRYFARQLHKTQLVLCQTRVIERRLRQRYRYRGGTAICPNAVSVFAINGEADDGIPAALEPFAEKMKLFCLTKYYPHKNLEGLVEMFRRFDRELQDVVAVITLGSEQPGAGRLLRSIERLGLSDRIINVGPLPQSVLGKYYRNCQALIMPTLLESFSGTYLEAMHFSTPILTSDLDFAREICGEAALYFDPWNPAAMKDAILRLKNDPELGRQLTARGRLRLQSMFKSWDEIAADVAELLTQVAHAG